MSTSSALQVNGRSHTADLISVAAGACQVLEIYLAFQLRLEPLQMCTSLDTVTTQPGTYPEQIVREIEMTAENIGTPALLVTTDVTGWPQNRVEELMAAIRSVVSRGGSPEEAPETGAWTPDLVERAMDLLAESQFLRSD